MNRFSLEPLLNNRKIIEENFQKKLSIHQIKLNKENETLSSLLTALEKALSETRIKSINNSDVSEIRLYSSFVEHLYRNIDHQKIIVHEAEKKRDEVREELLVAVKNRKIIEKLKEKWLKEYNQELSKNEQAFLDEIAINGFNRRVEPA